MRKINCHKWNGDILTLKHTEALEVVQTIPFHEFLLVDEQLCH